MRWVESAFFVFLAVFAVCEITLIVGSIAWDEGWKHVAARRAFDGHCETAWSAAANGGVLATYGVERYCPERAK